MNDKEQIFFDKIKSKIIVLFLVIQFFLLLFKVEVNLNINLTYTIWELVGVAILLPLLISSFYYLPIICVYKLTYRFTQTTDIEIEVPRNVPFIETLIERFSIPIYRKLSVIRC